MQRYFEARLKNTHHVFTNFVFSDKFDIPICAGGLNRNGKIMETEISSTRIFRIALTAAELLVKNGAEMSRAEETIIRICASRGITSPAVFVSPTVIIIGDDSRDGSTFIKNIKSRGSNIKKLSLVNDFSRKFTEKKIDEKDAFAILKDIENVKGYPDLLILITAGVGCGIFSMLLGGTINDFINDRSCSFVRRRTGVFENSFFEQFYSGLCRRHNYNLFLSHTIRQKFGYDNSRRGIVTRARCCFYLGD